jgi:hypothetical protein
MQSGCGFGPRGHGVERFGGLAGWSSNEGEGQAQGSRHHADAEKKLALTAK